MRSNRAFWLWVPLLAAAFVCCGCGSDGGSDGDTPTDGDGTPDGDTSPDGDTDQMDQTDQIDQTDQSDSDPSDGDAPDGDTGPDGDLTPDGDTDLDSDSDPTDQTDQTDSDPPDGDTPDGDSQPDECTPALPLACGDSLSHSTVVHGRQSLWYGYSPSARFEGGRETIYRFGPLDQVCPVTVRLRNLTVDLDLFVLGSCDPFSSVVFSAMPLDIQHGREEASFDATPGREYFVVVDGYAEDEGGYTIEVECLCPLDGDALDGDGAADGDTGRDSSCDDGTEPLCEIVPPVCGPHEILAWQNHCYRCVNPATCFPWGVAGCRTDADCDVNRHCHGCASGSCPDCLDCVAGCVLHGCSTEPAPVCNRLRPMCNPGLTAVVRDGCWVCVYLGGRCTPGHLLDMGCSDGSEPVCDRPAPQCDDSAILVVQDGCELCVNPKTCHPWGEPGCRFTGEGDDCPFWAVCVPCGTSSCPACDDCLPACRPLE